MKLWLLIKFFGSTVSVLGPLPLDVSACAEWMQRTQVEVHQAWEDPTKRTILQSLDAGYGRHLSDESDVSFACELAAKKPEFGP